MPSLDVGSWLQGNNLSLQDLGEKPGEVVVKDSLGQSTTLNIHEMLAKEGVNPKGLDLLYNDPSTAIQKSPVGLMDRLAMSVGNAKGQMNYLKNQFKDVRMNPDGQMAVNKDGAWYAVDPKGLGDGNGWDIAKEMVADVADMGGEAIKMGGMVAGAATGGIAGAAAGGAAASAATIALGRVLGTYDATPQEMIRDVALDAVLAAGGETVALGAKHMILPAMKSALGKIGELAPTEPGIKNFISNMLQASGIESGAAERIVNHSEAVLNEATALKQAAGPVTKGELQRKSVERMMADVGELAVNAQPSLSKGYVSKMAEAAAKMPENAVADVASGIKVGIEGIGDLGLIQPVTDSKGITVGYKPAPDTAIANALSVPGAIGKDLGKEAAKVVNQLNLVMKQTQPFKGPDAVKQALAVSKKIKDLHQVVADNVESGPVRDKLSKLMFDVNLSVLHGLPQEVQAGVQEAQSWYAQNIKQVAILKKALVAGRPDLVKLERLTNTLFDSPDQRVAVKQAFETVSKLVPNGQAIYDRVQNRAAAHELISTTPGNLIPDNGSVLGTAKNMLGRMAGIGPAANPVTTVQRIPTIVKKLGAFGSTLRNMSEPSRNALLRQPAILDAMMTETVKPGGQ